MAIISIPHLGSIPRWLGRPRLLTRLVLSLTPMLVRYLTGLRHLTLLQ
jgi:hypothetical protein